MKLSAASDAAHEQQRTEELHSLGPLWVITIAMGSFFGIAALIMMFA
jgi:hypothetical protein